MTIVDLNLRIKTKEEIPHFLRMAERLGYNQLVLPSHCLSSYETTSGPFSLYSRIHLTNERLGALKGNVRKFRKKNVVVSIPISSPSVSNWAAKDERVDILTLRQDSQAESIRQSTAKLASKSGTALEITIDSLLITDGFDRSRVLKYLRENIATAVDAGMRVVFSSGATEPMMMRSPRALQYIGTLLGMDTNQAKAAISVYPADIIKSNLKKLTANLVRPGVEIIEEG